LLGENLNFGLNTRGCAADMACVQHGKYSLINDKSYFQKTLTIIRYSIKWFHDFKHFLCSYTYIYQEYIYIKGPALPAEKREHFLIFFIRFFFILLHPPATHVSQIVLPFCRLYATYILYYTIYILMYVLFYYVYIYIHAF